MKTEKMDIYEAIETAEGIITEIAEDSRERTYINREDDIFILNEDLNWSLLMLKQIQNCKTLRAVKKIMMRSSTVLDRYNKGKLNKLFPV